MLLDRDVNLISYFPPVMAEMKETQAISKAIDNEFKRLWAYKNSIYCNQYIDTLDEIGCSKWEKALKIAVKTTDTLDVRRMRISCYFISDAPYTKNRLKATLDGICGSDGYSMNINYEDQKISILIERLSREKFDIVKEIVEKMIPADMLVDIQLHYVEYNLLKKYRHNDLKPYTHTEIREGVMEG